MSFSNPAELLLRTMLKQQQHLLQRVQANHTKSRFSSLLELLIPYILHFHVRFYFPFVFWVKNLPSYHICCLLRNDELKVTTLSLLTKPKPSC